MCDLAAFLNEIQDEMPNPIENIGLTQSTIDRLFPYQINHVIQLTNILKKSKIAIDTSDTGTGKTYSAIATTLESHIDNVIVLCPKIVISKWESVSNYFGIKPLDIVNYESIKNCKGGDNKSSIYIYETPYEKTYYKWQLPPNTLIIFDEAHRCKNPNSDNGKLLLSTNTTESRLLLLSATLYEKLGDLAIIFYLMRFIPRVEDYKKYIKTKQLTSSNILTIMSQIKISEIGSQFPSNHICCQEFNLDEAICTEMNDLYSQLGKLGNNYVLPQFIRIRQATELLKIPIFLELIDLYLEDRKSVIVFVVFRKTMRRLLRMLRSRHDIISIIHGKQTSQERDNAIDLFQTNKSRIIICQINSGGIGISLHDVTGAFPRVSLISMPLTGIDLKQALGRAARAGAKSQVLQIIVFAANVHCEDRIRELVNKKLANINTFTEIDFKIEF